MGIGKELNYWDVAAGEILVKEAGDLLISSIGIKQPLKRNIIAANSNIHEDLKALIKKRY